MYIGPWQELQLARGTLRQRDRSPVASLDAQAVAELQAAVRQQFQERETAEKVLDTLLPLVLQKQPRNVRRRFRHRHNLPPIELPASSSAQAGLRKSHTDSSLLMAPSPTDSTALSVRSFQSEPALQPQQHQSTMTMATETGTLAELASTQPGYDSRRACAVLRMAHTDAERASAVMRDYRSYWKWSGTAKQQHPSQQQLLPQTTTTCQPAESRAVRDAKQRRAVYLRPLSDPNEQQDDKQPTAANPKTDFFSPFSPALLPPISPSPRKSVVDESEEAEDLVAWSMALDLQAVG